jgi:HAD superfamily phosphoserine phosphatase-like hydrolase
MDQRPYAVFDIDGTIIRWQLYHAIADELVHSGILKSDDYQAVKQARKDWKNRVSDEAFAIYELTLVGFVENSLAGLSVDDVRIASMAVLKRYEKQVYTYTRNLISELRKQNYVLFALSASPSDIVSALADHYGFDDFGGSIYEALDGHYTGNRELLINDQKPMYLKKLIARHDVRNADSIAVGDSEGDIAMLGAVERPIAFNPTRLLADHAVAHKWEIILERKNVIYELQPDKSGYILANPTTTAIL